MIWKTAMEEYLVNSLTHREEQLNKNAAADMRTTPLSQRPWAGLV
jgi:hypothetical protein